MATPLLICRITDSWKSEVMPMQYGLKIASERGAMAKFYNNKIEEKATNHSNGISPNLLS